MTLILQFYLIQFIDHFLNVYYTTFLVIGKVIEPQAHLEQKFRQITPIDMHSGKKSIFLHTDYGKNSMTLWLNLTTTPSYTTANTYKTQPAGFGWPARLQILFYKTLV